MKKILIILVTILLSSCFSSGAVNDDKVDAVNQNIDNTIIEKDDSVKVRGFPTDNGPDI